MFNTNKTLGVKASMATSLHFIEHSIIIRPSEPDIHFIAKSIGSPPFNERFDYFKDFLLMEITNV